nr:MAG TPA: hypothetical protein [Bacteriophage sp.]
MQLRWPGVITEQSEHMQHVGKRMKGWEPIWHANQ